MVYNYVHSFDFPYQSIYISSSLIKAELLYYGTFENNSTAVSYCNSQLRVNPNTNPKPSYTRSFCDTKYTGFFLVLFIEENY